MDKVDGGFAEREAAKIKAYLESPEYQEKLTQRLQINDACLRSAEARALTYELCKSDPIFYVENFGWTFDPRRNPHHFPFILFDYQKDALFWIIAHIREGKDGLIEKSRDMGVTWLIVWALYYLWKFDEAFSGLAGSYKEAEVDDRGDRSFFGKLDYAIRNTPKWLLPKKFKFKDHRQRMKLVNPENYNIIQGDTMNSDFSRGSRRSVVYLDEGASWEYFRDAWRSAGDATPCRLTVSTPKGRNAFSELRESGIDVLTLHWKLHPFKDQELYEYEKNRRTEEDVAQELDISYHKSQVGRVYPEWDMVKYEAAPYNQELPLYISWDFGQTDDTAMIWWQTKGNQAIIIDSYSNRGKTIDFYVPFVTGVRPSESLFYSKRDYEVIDAHAGWKRAIHFGDPAGRFTNQVTNQSVMGVLKQYGINVLFREEAKDFQSRKTASKLLMRNLIVNENDRNKDLGIAIENARYPEVSRGGGSDIRSIKPIHDWTSHFRSSFEYFAVNWQKFSLNRRVIDKFPVRGNSKRTVSY